MEYEGFVRLRGNGRAHSPGAHHQVRGKGPDDLLRPALRRHQKKGGLDVAVDVVGGQVCGHRQPGSPGDPHRPAGGGPAALQGAGGEGVHPFLWRQLGLLRPALRRHQKKGGLDVAVDVVGGQPPLDPHGLKVIGIYCRLLLIFMEQ